MPQVTFTRFVAPAQPEGAWIAYYERFAFALQTPDAELYRLVPAITRHATAGTLDATTLDLVSSRETASAASLPFKVKLGL
jgi:hypothetical protein